MTTTPNDAAAGASPADSTITVVDLFSGAGGFSAGFHTFKPDGTDNSPFRTVAAVEFDQAAAASYAANFPTTDVFADDIANWQADQYAGRVDVIMGGPPCQGFSGLGKEDPEDPRNLLWTEYMRVVTTIRPKIFVLENVDRFLKSQQFEDLRKSTVAGGKLENYELRWKVLNAADYGVPQARRRAIVIATRKDLGVALEHPRPTHTRTAKALQQTLDDSEVGGQLLPWEPVGKAVFNLTPRDAPTKELPVGRAASPLGLQLPGPFETRELHIGRTPTDLSKARYAAIPEGGNRHDLRNKYAMVNGERTYLSTTSWDGHNTGSGDVMGRMHADRPSVTIRTEFYKPEKGRYLHPVEPRPITHYEAALIQGFPDDFKWFGSKIQIARQIGNAVPIGLGRALAQAIYRRLTH
ncbi:DNA cytosine methyltransferase [Streptomyces sp. NPDC006530]|uniref:DNA cytosine methyltransferase n=1 Tax=Streptomyces sp. NPDC006530 TaxID=3364750 RepID=UPI0036A22E64